MSSARFSHTATRLTNGKVLVAGGRTTAAAYGSCELYDPATGKARFLFAAHESDAVQERGRLRAAFRSFGMGTQPRCWPTEGFW